MRTPITYYGGKQGLTKHLLPLIPPHKIYCEPFFGGGALFFAKTPSEVEVINDVNSEVINFFKVAKTNFSELQKEVIGTPHSRELFKRAKAVYEFPDMFSEVKRAWAFWVLTNQGFAGMVDSWGFGKDNSKERALSNKRIDFMEAYAKRLDTVQMEHHDALRVIERCDSKESFIYCDPPYFNSDMGHYANYNETDFKNLLDCLSKLKGKFLLSSYPSALLTTYIKKYKWKIKQVKKSVYVTKHTNKQKIELMVFNYDEPSVGDMSGLSKLNSFENEHLSEQKLIDAGDKFIADYTQELNYMNAFLDFHNKILTKEVLEKFINDLQNSIRKRYISKESLFAKDIEFIQNSVLGLYNKMTSPQQIVIKPSTNKRFNKLIGKATELNNAFLHQLMESLSA